METIIKELNNFISSPNLNLKSYIEISDVNNLIITFENNRPIPINFYNKNLIEIKNNKIKCNKCVKIAQYKCNDEFLCWTHSHSIN